VARRRPARLIIKSILSHAALISLSIVFLIPFAWLLTSSFKSESHLFTKPPEWIPRGEYVHLGDGRWAEVIRQEVLEYHPLEYDEQGRALERRPKRTKVTLVDREGNPLLKDLFTVDPPVDLDDMDQGIIHAALKEGFAKAGIQLPSQPRLKPVWAGYRWEIPVGETTYTLEHRDASIHVLTDEPSRMVVDSERIETKAWPTFRHYVKGIEGFHFSLFLQNTLRIALFSVIGTVLSSSWVAFGFSILEWRGRDKLFYLMLATMMLPPQVTMIPVFVIFKSLGWCNTYLPLIVPTFLGNAFFIFLLRQFFLTIPRSLDDAARLDGCGELRILWHVILPSARPALATVAAFAIIWTWGDFYWPLLATSSTDMRTLEVGLSVFSDAYSGTRWPLQMAAAVIVLTPVLIVFLAVQRFFVRGATMSGIKG